MSRSTRARSRRPIFARLTVLGAVLFYISTFFFEFAITLPVWPGVQDHFTLEYGTLRLDDEFSYPLKPHIEFSVERIRWPQHGRWYTTGWHTLLPGAVGRVWGASSVVAMAIAPLWPFVLVIILFRRHALIFWRKPPGHCRKCGYDLRLNESGVCPECGVEVAR